MSLDLLKAHLYLDATDTTDDVILTQYLEAAETFVSNYLNHDFDENNKVHVQAALLTAGSWWLSRENEIMLSFSEAPLGVKCILDSEKSLVI